MDSLFFIGLLSLSAQIEIPEVVIGLTDAIIICASLISRLVYNKKNRT
ncbi:hypothetical protein I6I20_07890 [Lactococcus garvieae]|nr:hypothetical protein I6I20_07890 [Lactococcus garvieae]